MKKFLSIIISVSLIISSSFIVLGIESDIVNSSDVSQEKVYVESFVLDENDPENCRYLFVIHYDAKYSQKGEEAFVFFDVYADSERKDLVKSVEIPKESVTVEVFGYNNISYSQIFISVPNDFNEDTSRTVVRVNGNVFLTENGETSGVVEVPCEKFFDNGKYLELSCTANQALSKERDFEILVGSDVKVNVKIPNSYETLWKENMKINFYYNGEKIDVTGDTLTAENLGDYTIEFYLNDQFKSVKNFKAVIGVRRYFEALLESTWNLITAPFYFIGGILACLIPGTIVLGGFSVLSSFLSVANFFKSVFGIDTSFVYTFR